MQRPAHDVRSLGDALRRASGRERWLRAPGASVALHDLARGTGLACRPDELRGRTVLVRTRDPLTAALALIQSDGVARRLVLCPPDLSDEHIPYVVATAVVDAIVSDDVAAHRGVGVERLVACSATIEPSEVEPGEWLDTEWILFTSGTTGRPKMVVHTLATLTGAITSGGALGGAYVWGTFYDIRRYGGLQILLRAVIGGGSLVLSGEQEPVGEFLRRAAEAGVTHLTGTPSHWRRALMNPAARAVVPLYARLSGEIADQGILDALRAAFPGAAVSHAFASTEVGVVFEVSDGRAGFPMHMIENGASGVAMKIEDESLRVRSSRMALRYLGDSPDALTDETGFVDTGDMVELRDGRYYFVGRRDGIINVGGLKVHPEEVEAVLHRHPRVRMALVTARKNPITGAIVVADVVCAGHGIATEHLENELLASCRQSLAPHKVPASIRFVSSLDVTPAGKMVRGDT